MASRSQAALAAAAAGLTWALAGCSAGPAKVPMAYVAPVQVYAAGSLRGNDSCAGQGLSVEEPK